MGFTAGRDPANVKKGERYGDQIPAIPPALDQRSRGFWGEQANLIHWQKPFGKVLDYSRPPFAKWFVGGETNLCHNAVDRHLKDRPDQNALIFISTETDVEKIYSFRELHAEVNRCAAMMQGLGVGKGDRVLIYMPMIAEACFAILANPMGVEDIPRKFGSPGFPMYGYNLKLLHESTGEELGTDEKGVVAIVPPLPPGCMSTVWGDDERFVETYFETIPGRQVYSTFDWGIRDQDGYYLILGRTDDVINVAGHRLGTREIEESISSHAAIAEVAVIGVADQLKGQVPVAFAVLRDPSQIESSEGRMKLEGDVMKTVDQQLGAIGRPARVHFVTLLPKTRSGKVLRRSIQAICEGRDPGDLTTIEDPSALQQVRDAVCKK